MYDLAKRAALAFLKVPPEPEDPFGHRGTLRVFRASPAYWRYRLLGWGIGQAVGIGGLILVAIGMHVGASAVKANATGHGILFALEFIGLLFAVVEIALSYAALRLDFEMRWYKVTDRSLRIREGVWIVREQTMTFANVQNVSLNQGPLERIFGFANLEVRSAGGGGHAAQSKQEGGAGLDMHCAVFRGLDDATTIRDLVMARVREARDGGLGDPDDAGEAAPSPAAAPASGAGRSALLASIREEAAALRRAAEKAAGGGRPA